MNKIAVIIAIWCLGLVSCRQPIKRQANIVVSNCDIKIEQEFLTDTIISKFKLELQNENIATNFSDIIESTISSLEKSKEDRNFLWPYYGVDSAFYEAYASFNGDMDRLNLENREIKRSTKLCKKKITAILNLMNNPNYFSYGECGTAMPEAMIKLYQGGHIIGTIAFSCSHGQTSCIPENTLYKFGGFNELGNKLLDDIRPWE